MPYKFNASRPRKGRVPAKLRWAVVTAQASELAETLQAVTDEAGRIFTVLPSEGEYLVVSYRNESWLKAVATETAENTIDVPPKKKRGRPKALPAPSVEDVNGHPV